VRHETRLTLRYSSRERAHRVERAVSPELDGLDDDRSRTRLGRSGETLTLVVEAADLVALRAGLNTWLSLVSVAERAGDVC
jgi:KEOPS complex subunit Pcc1